MIPGIDTGGGGLSNSSSATAGPATSGGASTFGGGTRVSYKSGINSTYLIVAAAVVAVIYFAKK